MGTLYKRGKGSQMWMMAVSIKGRQRCKSAKTSNKKLAKQLLAKWETEVFERRNHLPLSNSPQFGEWALNFLATIKHANTKKRYGCSLNQLMLKFERLRLSDISGEEIEDYIASRLDAGVTAATINHDLRVLRRMLRIALRKRLIFYSPFDQIEFLKQDQARLPHVMPVEEEIRILAVASSLMRMLIILLVDTGMRPYKEALPLTWPDCDFEDDMFSVKESKTNAGIRKIPMTKRCKAELLAWKQLSSRNGLSEFVFPSSRKSGEHLKDIRGAWAKMLRDAKVDHFWIYNLRHTFASRLSAAGVADLFVAQMIGHSGTGILHKYSKAIDEYRRSAITKLELLLVSSQEIRKIPAPSIQ